MNEDQYFTMYDATICIWTATPKDQSLYDKLKRAMKDLGFTWERDPHIVKNYPSLASTHHYGRLEDLEFTAEIFPAGMKFSFFQNVVFKNPNGGKYDFDRVKKMPYLTRLRFIKTTTKLKALLTKEGFRDRSRKSFSRAVDFVMDRRKNVEKFQGKAFYSKPELPCNITDADGKAMSDGDFRYYRAYNGRLAKGIVYRNLNNMWWVVVNDSTWDNVASLRMFSWKPGVKRRELCNPLARMKDRLNELVENQDFERAIGLRDAIQREKAKADNKKTAEVA